MAMFSNRGRSGSYGPTKILHDGSYAEAGILPYLQRPIYAGFENRIVFGSD